MKTKIIRLVLVTAICLFSCKKEITTKKENIKTEKNIEQKLEKVFSEQLQFIQNNESIEGNYASFLTKKLDTIDIYSIENEIIDNSFQGKILDVKYTKNLTEIGCHEEIKDRVLNYIVSYEVTTHSPFVTPILAVEAAHVVVQTTETGDNVSAIVGSWEVENNDEAWRDIIIDKDYEITFISGPCVVNAKIVTIKNENIIFYKYHECKISFDSDSSCKEKEIGKCYLNSKDKLVVEINTKNKSCNVIESGKYILKRSVY